MVDYSKWNNIDVSEDEDDYHPNIDQVVCLMNGGVIPRYISLRSAVCVFASNLIYIALPPVRQASLWKWKKEARVLREQQEAAEKQKVKEEHEKALKALKEAEQKLQTKGRRHARSIV